MIDTKNTMDSDSLPSYVKVVVVETTSELRKLGPRVQHSSHIGFWKGRLTLVDLSTSYSMKIWIRFPQIIGFNQPKWGSRWHGHVLFDLNRIRTHISRQNIFSLIENIPRKHDYTYLGVFNVRRRGIDSMVIDPWVFLKIWVTHTLSWIGFWGKW